METEKVNTGETAPDKDFLARVNEIADELRSMAEKDRENRFVLLIAGEEKQEKISVAQLIYGRSDLLTENSGRSLAAVKEGCSAIHEIFVCWLESIDQNLALNVAKVLHETVKQRSKEEAFRPKAEA